MTGTMKRLGSIDELAFSAVLSDLDGVVYRGEEAVPGAIEQFNRWQSAGVPYCFVTNNAEKHPDAFAEKIRRLGIACQAEQVVTSGDVTLNYVRSQYALGTGLPVVTVVGMRIGGLIGGAVTIETVFAWPGVGMLLVNSVNQRDLAIVQAVVLLIALTMVVVNLIVDLTYGWLDPRIEVHNRKATA